MSVDVGSSVRRGSVWEEALLEELIYAIAHIAHAEQHLIEIETLQDKPTLAHLINTLRMCRKEVGNILFNHIEVSDGSGGEFRSKAESFWCCLKHSAMALIHCDEVIEKLIKRLADSVVDGGLKSVESDDVKLILTELVEAYKVRKSLREVLMRIVKEGPSMISPTTSTRCREDLCIEGDVNE